MDVLVFIKGKIQTCDFYCVRANDELELGKELEIGVGDRVRGFA